MQRFKPILFSTPMVQAILEGRKSMTRRIIKTDAKKIFWNEIVLNGYGGYCDEHGNPVKSKYSIGDVLWVRETFRVIEQDFGKPRYEYKATEKINLTDKWKPSIFMPFDACRIFLKIKNIRVEELQNISNADAFNEGIEWKIKFPEEHPDLKYYRDYMFKDRFATGILFEAKHSFKSLWFKINGRESWEENPFVWVISFEKIDKPVNFK